MKLLDTWVWIEYFKGSKEGARVKSIMEKSTVYTSAISLAEISKWVCQNNGDLDFAVKQIKTNSIIIDLEEIVLLEAGKNYVEVRKIKNAMGLIDIIIYTCADIHSLTVVTGDPDFEGLPNVEMIK